MKMIMDKDEVNEERKVKRLMNKIMEGIVLMK
jgi:hypothetical protein